MTINSSESKLQVGICIYQVSAKFLNIVNSFPPLAEKTISTNEGGMIFMKTMDSRYKLALTDIGQELVNLTA